MFELEDGNENSLGVFNLKLSCMAWCVCWISTGLNDSVCLRIGICSEVFACHALYFVFFRLYWA